MMQVSCAVMRGGGRFVLSDKRLIATSLREEKSPGQLYVSKKPKAMRSKCYFIGVTLANNPISDHFASLAEELVSRGHRVVIITPRRRVDLVDPEAQPAIYTWPSERPTRLRDARFLARLIGNRVPDCLVANFGAVNVMSLVGWWCGVRRRVAWYHTLSSQIGTDAGVSRSWLHLLQMRKGLCYGASTDIVSVSCAAQEDFARLYPSQQSKCRVFLNSLADPMLECKVAVGERVKRLMCVARFNPSKGQDVLIQSVALLKDRHPDLSVELVGGGPSKEGCERLALELGIAERCRFAGWLQHEEVLRRMAGAWATVLPSRSEALGLVVIESLAVGTPVVGSRVGGIPEIVRDGVDGFLVSPDDPAALAERLDRLLTDLQLYRRFCTSARKGFLERFEQRQAVQAQADWLEEIVV